jgi:diaminohydroxyphosphoribosylaminopyrimidine deaminase/5-amino-6-(5-phosphoribosylamino)uracil reductase
MEQDLPLPEDKKWMKVALSLGERGFMKTAPNPAVGAVVVKDGKIAGKGFHERAGAPHAEVMALKMAGEDARGGTLYVTLEPCNHFGKTPPCTSAILEAKISRVVYGTKDPNPDVKGGGGEYLRKKGIKVTSGVEEESCQELIRNFSVWVLEKRPYFLHKSALTMDGAVATYGRGREKISGEKSRKKVHHLRYEVDAVIVGGGTFRKDLPDLRPRGVKRKKEEGDRPIPLRVLISRTLPEPIGPFVTENPERSLVFTTLCKEDERKRWEEKGVEVVLFHPQEFSLLTIARNLFARGVYHALVEGGSTLRTLFLKEKLIDEMILIYAPLWVGGKPSLTLFSSDPEPIEKAWKGKIRKVEKVGEDLWVYLLPKRENPSKEGK